MFYGIWHISTWYVTLISATFEYAEEKAVGIEVNNSDTYFLWVFKNTSSMFMTLVHAT